MELSNNSKATLFEVRARMITRKRPTRLLRYALIGSLLAAVGAGWRLSLAGGVGHLDVHMQINFPTGATGVAWSESSNRLAVYSGKNVSIWDIKGNKLNEMIRDIPGPWYGSSIAFLGNEDLLLTPPARYSELYKQDTLSLWDIRQGAVVKHIDGPSPGAGSGSNWAYVFAVSSDKSTVAIVTHGGLKITTYSTQTWTMLSNLVLNLDNATAIALSPDGTLAALGTAGGKIAIFGTKTGDLIHTIDAYPHLGMAVTALTFSPDGSRIVTGASLTINQTQDDAPVRIWAIGDGDLVRSFHEKGLQPIRSLTWRAQGDRIAFVAKDDRVRIWNLMDDTVATWRLQPDVMAAAFSPNGDYLAVCNGDHLTIFGVGQPDR